MKFYHLLNCFDLAQVGIFPQVQTHDYTGQDISLNCALEQPFRPLPPKYKVPKGFLSNKAKLTDFISDSITLYSIVISDRVKLFLEKYKLSGIAFVPTSILRRGNSYNYWFMVPVERGFDLIDLEKTAIAKFTDIMRRNPVAIIHPKNIEDAKDLLNFSDPTLNDLTIYQISQTQLKPHLNLDLFCLSKFNDNSGIYISEHLYEALMAEGFTGLSIDKDFFLVSPDPIS